MTRSKWKLNYFSKSIWRKIFFLKRSDFFLNKYRYYDRSSTIPACFYSYNLRIHKGKYSTRVAVNLFNIGYKFGEFSFTRKPYHFPLKKMRKKKNFFIRK